MLLCGCCAVDIQAEPRRSSIDFAQARPVNVKKWPHPREDLASRAHTATWVAWPNVVLARRAYRRYCSLLRPEIPTNK